MRTSFLGFLASSFFEPGSERGETIPDFSSCAHYANHGKKKSIRVLQRWVSRVPSSSSSFLQEMILSSSSALFLEFVVLGGCQSVISKLLLFIRLGLDFFCVSPQSLHHWRWKKKRKGLEDKKKSLEDKTKKKKKQQQQQQQQILNGRRAALEQDVRAPWICTLYFIASCFFQCYNTFHCVHPARLHTHMHLLSRDNS